MSVVALRGLAKSYRHYHSGSDRLREVLFGRARHRVIHALHPMDLDIGEGHVVGVVGRNGSGKSTLLKLIAGTIQPSAGSIRVQGRIAALLELGSGFHPELSGGENVQLACAMAGVPRADMDARWRDIVAFSEIGELIDQPVKTYSSGMRMRLAFAAATSVDPDLLIIDEALSVGDGAFARKSFDRILRFKEAGKTILFCSHSLYQVEAICDRALWLEAGRVRMDATPPEVTKRYRAFLDSYQSGAGAAEPAVDAPEAPAAPRAAPPEAPGASARIEGVSAALEGQTGVALRGVHGRGDLRLEIRFRSDPSVPPPTVGVRVTSEAGHFVTSMSTRVAGFEPRRGPDGAGAVRLEVPALPLLKGHYTIDVFLLCERAVLVYDKALAAVSLDVTQTELLQGLATVPHRWSHPAHLANTP